MSDSAEPGWYHAEGDPPDTERYWDGFAWTDGPRPIGGVAASAGTEVAPASEPDLAMPGSDTPGLDMSEMDTPTEVSFEPADPGPTATPPTEAPPTGAPPTDMPVMGSTSGATGLDAGFPSMDDPAPSAGSYAAGTPDIPGVAPGGFSSATPATPPPGYAPAASSPPGNFGGGSTFPGAPVGGAFQAFPEESQATTSLVLSVVGLFCCGLPAVVGVGMGFNEKKAIDEGRRDPANRGQVIAGMVIGGLAIVVWGIAALIAVLGAAAF